MKNRTLDDIKEDLQLAYTRADLLKHYYVAAIEVIRSNQQLVRDQGYTATQIGTWLNMKNPPKEPLAEMTAVLFSHADLFNAYLKTLTPEGKRLWEIIKEHRRISHRTLESQFGIDVLDRGANLRGTYYGRDSEVLRPEFRHFHVHHRMVDEDVHFYLTLPLSIRQRVRSFYPLPEYAQLTGMDSPPESAHRYVHSESMVFSEWPRIMSGWRNGYFSFTIKGRPTGIAKTAKALKLQEYFPDSEARYRHLRTHLIGGLFAWADPRSMPEAPLEGIRYLFREVYANRAMTTPFVLTDLKGLGSMDTHDFMRIETGLLSLLQSMPAGQWVESDRLFAYANWQSLLSYPFLFPVESFKLQWPKPGPPHPYLIPSVNPENEERWIHRSLLNGTMFLFAAFGLLELAYGAPRPGEDPPWNALVAVRRTALGDHILGLSEAYQPSLPEDEVRPIFSAEGLLITLTDDQHRLAGLLEPYTERVGVGKYQASEAHFLKGVKNRKELQGRIALFRQLIGEGLPEHWQRFFKDLEDKVDPLTLLAEFLVYQLRPEDKALIQLFGRDPVLRTLAVKAEGFRVLIPRTRDIELRKRLRELGYLMT